MTDSGSGSNVDHSFCGWQMKLQIIDEAEDQRPEFGADAIFTRFPVIHHGHAGMGAEMLQELSMGFRPRRSSRILKGRDEMDGVVDLSL